MHNKTRIKNSITIFFDLSFSNIYPCLSLLFLGLVFPLSFTESASGMNMAAVGGASLANQKEGYR